MDEKRKRQNTTEQADRQGTEERRKGLVLFLVLLLLFSGIGASLMLNHHTEEIPSVDTITVDPIEKRSLHVSGQVAYAEGRAYQDGRVQLHSDVKETRTDAKGWFLFKDVNPDEHTLSVLDGEGNGIARALLSVKQEQKGKDFKITKNRDGEYVVHVSAAVRYLELKVAIDGDKLLLIPENSYAVTDQGTVFTQDGQLKMNDGQIVLPSGSVILENNTIVHSPYMVRPDNTVVNIPEEGITLEDGTATERPEDEPSNVTPDGDVHPILTSEPDTPAIPDTPAVPDQPTEPDPPVDPDQPTGPDTPDTPDEPLSPPDGYTVRGNNRAGWTSPWNVTMPLTALDLFDTGRRNRENIPIIQPGSEGSYLFCLENNRTTDLSVEIYLEQVSIAGFPLEYRLSEVQSVDSTVASSVEWQRLEGGTRTLFTDGTIGHASTANRRLYRLEWRWPSGQTEKADKTDTELGKDQSKFEVKLGVHVEEVIKGQ